MPRGAHLGCVRRYTVHRTQAGRYMARKSYREFRIFDTFGEAETWADAQNAAHELKIKGTNNA
jgi:hypothetical protein